MRQTLFYWPHETLGIPWFGVMSWGTLILVLMSVIPLVFLKSQEERTKSIQANGFTWLMIFLAISFLLPRIEYRLDDQPIGLPIRGYGVMMMLGVLAGCFIALKRCESRGIPRDAFFSLATWTVAAGVVGARLFYVVQYWHQLPGATLSEKLWTVLQVTEGGLVVYGSVIGGLVVITCWTLRYRIPVLLVADAVTPAFFVGLMFGRFGCFLNGCCYGGVCELPLPAVRFPSGSVVYMEQLESGRMVGLITKDNIIKKVLPDSWADKNQLRAEQRLDSVIPHAITGPTPENPMAIPKFEAVISVDGSKKWVDSNSLPTRSIPVHPSQLYASIGGLLLFLWTLSLSNYFKQTGLIFGCGLISYGVVRILEELIRVDEGGQFGTSLSIATWISLIGIIGGISILLSRCLLGDKTSLTGK